MPCDQATLNDGPTDSNVVVVNGIRDFAWVLKESKKQTVVVKVFAENSPDSQKAITAYQEVAKDKKNAVFAAMDIFGHQGQESQNYQLVVRMMLMVGVTRLSLPTFLFFRNGRLANENPIIQGYKSKNELHSSIAQRLVDTDGQSDS